MPSGIAIRCDGVSLTYHAKSGAPVEALRRVTFRVPPHKVTAVIGPSGCGKSTLLLIIRGLLAPTAGQILFVDEATGAAAAAKPRMATVWQSFNLFPWRTVGENVAFGLELSGMSRSARTERVRRALGLVDLAGFETKYPRQLSGGMRQRVGLARALVMEPDIVLLDEPFGALDAITRAELQEWLLAALAAEPRTVLLVTHDVEEALLLCERVVVLAEGRVTAAFEVDIARDAPRREVVTSAAFIQLRERALEAIG